MLIKLLITIGLLSLTGANPHLPPLNAAQITCKNVGNQKVIYDPSCENGGDGCNAGGQGQDCRFCWAVPEKCVTTTMAPVVPTTTRTTTTTTAAPPVKTTTTTTKGPHAPTKSTQHQPSAGTPPTGNVVVKSTTGLPSGVIFQDNFDTLDFQTWKHELTMAGGGNWEFEWYVNNRTNSYAKDGILYIKPTMTTEAIGDLMADVNIWGGQPADVCTMNQFYGCERNGAASGNVANPIRSARIRTAEHFSFRYGKIEVRAKMPKGDWLWPAIWMLPVDQEYGQWPVSGEIDMIESRGNDPSYSAGGRDQIGTTLHYGPDYAHDPYEKTHAVYNLPGGKTFADDFHVFGFIWSDTGMKSYIDDESNVVLNVDCSETDFFTRGKFGPNFDNPWQYSKSKCAPFDKPFYFVMNLAVGGTGGYFPEGVGGKPWSNTDPKSVNAFWSARAQWQATWDLTGDDSSLQVDYIKVTAL